MQKFSLAIACFGSFVAASQLVRADAGDAAAAETLFRRGREAMEAKNYREACPRFAESQRLDPAAGTLMNLAACEERLGRLASAWQHWKEAIDALPANDDRVGFARGRVSELEKKLPRLAVRLAADSDGARVFRDEVELGAASRGLLLPVDPGQHTVTVRLAGHRPEQVMVTLREGEEKQITVRPGDIDPSAETSGRRRGSSTPRTLGWVLGGIGVAGLGTAAISGLLLMDAKSTADVNCPNKSCLNQEGLDAVAEGKTLVVINTTGWAAAGVGLGVGTYLILSSPRSAPATAIVPSVGRDGAGVFYRGSF